MKNKRVLSEEHKQKISKALKNKSKNKGKIPWNKGIKGVFKHSDETKNKIKKAMIGREILWADKIKKSLRLKWNTKERELTTEDLRKTYEYKKWRKAVFKRDNYTCQVCNIRNKKGLGKTIILEAHHIKPFALFVELRFDINNGLTLCQECHKLTDTYAKRIDRKSYDAKV